MSHVQYYLCGGTGINIGVALKAGARTSANKNAGYVGLDTSDKNNTAEFPIERLEGAAGSGKDSTLLFEKMVPFVTSVLKKYKPAVHNIVVANSAGGTGRAQAMIALRQLIEGGHQVALCLISDHTSLIEKQNAVNGVRTFANQTAANQLNAPVCYLEFFNTEDKTRGEVNAEVVDNLNLLSLLFNPGNTEMDIEDVKRFFNYSAGGKIPPALSRIRFYDQDGASEYDGKPPVAVASLFTESDLVVPRFSGSLYRTTGVFADGVDGSDRPKKITELHVTLDHGEALVDLEKEIEELETAQAKAAVDYTKQKDISAGSNSMGFML